jgi:hypothetical protein
VAEKRVLELACRIRALELKLLELFREGKLAGTVHTYVGQELCAASFAGSWSPDDDPVFFTVLDGRFASLRIGDHTSTGTGAQLYSHNTIDRTMTEGQSPVYRADTVIGRACFVSPLTIVGLGSKIGDHCFVAAGSYVQGEFSPNSYIAGNPGRRVGRVEIRNKRVLLLKE